MSNVELKVLGLNVITMILCFQYSFCFGEGSAKVKQR